MNDTYYFAMAAATKTHTLAQIQAKNPGKLVVVDPGKTKGGVNLKKVAKAHNKQIKAKQDADKLKVVDAGKTKHGLDIPKIAKAHNKAIRSAIEQKHKAETTSNSEEAKHRKASAISHQLTAHHISTALHPSHLQAHQHAVERRMVHFNDPVVHHLTLAKQTAKVAADHQHKAEQLKQLHPSHLQAHEHAVEARPDLPAPLLAHEHAIRRRTPGDDLANQPLIPPSVSAPIKISGPVLNPNAHLGPDIPAGQPIPKPDNSMLPLQNESFGFTNETKNKTPYNLAVGNNPHITINPYVHPKTTQTSQNITKGTPNPFINPNPNLAFPDVGKGLTNAVNSIFNPPTAKNPISNAVTKGHHHHQHQITVADVTRDPSRTAEFNAQPKAVKQQQIALQIAKHNQFLNATKASDKNSHPDAIAKQADELLKASGSSGGMDMGGGQLTPQELATLQADAAEDVNTNLNIKFAPQGYQQTQPGSTFANIEGGNIFGDDGTGSQITHQAANQILTSNYGYESDNDTMIGLLGLGAIALLFLTYMNS